MTPLSPARVPGAVVRVLRVTAEPVVPVQQVVVAEVPAASVVPRQIDPVGLRLLALQRENDDLRAQLERARTA